MLFVWYESFVQTIKDTISEASKSKIQDYFLDAVIAALMSLGRVVPNFFRRGQNRRPTSGAEGGFGSMPPVTSSPSYYGGFDPTNPPRQPPSTLAPASQASLPSIQPAQLAPETPVPAMSQADARGEYDSRTLYERGEAPRVVVSAGGPPAAGRIGGFLDAPLGPNLVADAAKDIAQGIGEMIRPTDTGGSVVASLPPAQTSTPVASPTQSPTLNEMSMQGKLFTYAFACVLAGGSLIQQLGGIAIFQRDWAERQYARELDIVRNSPFREVVLQNYRDGRTIGENALAVVARGGTELLERMQRSYFGHQMLQVGIQLTPNIITEAIFAIYNRGIEVLREDFPRQLQLGNVRVEEHHQQNAFGIHAQHFINMFTRYLQALNANNRGVDESARQFFFNQQRLLRIEAPQASQSLRYAVDNADTSGNALDYCFSVFRNLYNQVGGIVITDAVFNQMKQIYERFSPIYDVQAEPQARPQEQAEAEARPQEEVAAPSVVSLTTLRDGLDRIRRATQPAGVQGRPRYTTAPQVQRLGEEIKTTLNQVRDYIIQNRLGDPPYPEITIDMTQIDRATDLRNKLSQQGAPRKNLKDFQRTLSPGEFRTYLDVLLLAISAAIPTR
jgi:hypothetical protein